MRFQVKEIRDFSYILDAIDVMPKKKKLRGWRLKLLDATLAFLITSIWALIIYAVWQKRK